MANEERFRREFIDAGGPNSLFGLSERQYIESRLRDESGGVIDLQDTTLNQSDVSGEQPGPFEIGSDQIFFTDSEEPDVLSCSAPAPARETPRTERQSQATAGFFAGLRRHRQLRAEQAPEEFRASGGEATWGMSEGDFVRMRRCAVL